MNFIGPIWKRLEISVESLLIRCTREAARAYQSGGRKVHLRGPLQGAQRLKARVVFR
jgi:hypothetical protein